MARKTNRAARAAVIIALVGAAAGWQTFAAFSSTTSNSGNEFTAGTVFIADNDSGCAMYDAPAPTSGACSGVTIDAENQAPGAVVEACYNATYTGTLPADVKMYWTGAGVADTLSSYLDLKVEQGTGAAGFNDCTGFTPAASNAVLYDDVLSGFNTSASPLATLSPDSQTAWNA
jgi:hypothetical protein